MFETTNHSWNFSHRKTCTAVHTVITPCIETVSLPLLIHNDTVYDDVRSRTKLTGKPLYHRYTVFPPIVQPRIIQGTVPGTRQKHFDINRGYLLMYAFTRVCKDRGKVFRKMTCSLAGPVAFWYLKNSTKSVKIQLGKIAELTKHTF